jgi:hypothetical protein
LDIPLLEESIDLEVLDLAAVAHQLTHPPIEANITVEGGSVPELRSALAADLLPPAFGQAIGWANYDTAQGTFRLSESVVEAIEPLLRKDDWSINHVNLHTESRWLVEGFDWSDDCCPLRFAPELDAWAASIVASGAARDWKRDE